MDKAKHTGWQASDFERYYKNNMAPEERHALEKDALDDPFLQDALEGYSHTDTPVNDVKKIKAALNTDNKKAPVIWYQQMKKSTLWKIAAMLIVFVGLTWIYIADTNEKPTTKLVTLVNDDSTPHLIDSVSIENQSAIVSKEKNEPVTETTMLAKTEVVKKKDAPAIAHEPTILRSNDKRAPELIAATQLKISTLASPLAKADSVEIVNIKGAAAKNITTPPAAKVEELGDGQGSGSITVIRGRVLDTDGSPVPYARINEPGNNQSLSSDKDGFFSLNNPGKLLNVNVNALGYEATNAILSPENPENKIILKETENLALNEIKVSANANKASKAITEDRTQTVGISGVSAGPGLKLINAVPVDGWKKYNQQIDNLRKGQDKPDAAGEVTLSFKVDSTGRPVDIKVIKSLTPATDTAAIYLLQHTLPLREIKKDKQSSVTISFK